MAHEHVHWTGHSSRLSRPYFESVENAVAEGARAREELVAELGAVIVCNTLGLEHEPVANHAAYLKHWAQALRSEDGPAVIHAASTAATRAASFIVGGIEAHRSRDDQAEQNNAAAEQPPQQTPEGQLVLLPSQEPADAAGGATQAHEAAQELPDAATRPRQPQQAADAAARPSQAQQPAEVALVAQGVGPEPGFDIASREERLKMARRIMERAVSGCVSEEEAAAQIAALLDIGESEIVKTAPARARAMGIGL